MLMLFYSLLVFGCVAIGVIRGFRRGLARQTPALIGIAFGIISARLLAPGLEPALHGAFASFQGETHEQFACDVLSTSLIFTGVYSIFRVVTGFLGKVMGRGESSILGNLGGALFGLFKYMLWLSIGLNVWLAMRPEGTLLNAVKSDDGNAVEEVMLLSPALLGGEDAADLSHRIQLREARKIS